MAANDRSCKICRFSQIVHVKEHNLNVTLCRKHAPAPRLGPSESLGEYRAHWPIVSPDDWCGDWQGPSHWSH